MIRFLSDLGRGFVAIGSCVTIFAATLAGYLFVGDWLGIGLGFSGGCIAAGLIFGLVATLYDIRDNVRLIAERAEPAETIKTPYINSAPEGREDLRAL